MKNLIKTKMFKFALGGSMTIFSVAVAFSASEIKTIFEVPELYNNFGNAGIAIVVFLLNLPLLSGLLSNWETE